MVSPAPAWKGVGCERKVSGRPESLSSPKAPSSSDGPVEHAMHAGAGRLRAKHWQPRAQGGERNADTRSWDALAGLGDIDPQETKIIAGWPSRPSRTRRIDGLEWPHREGLEAVSAGEGVGLPSDRRLVAFRDWV